MYTRNSTSPKKFGRPTFARKAKPHFNNSKSSFKRGSGASYRKGGANKRSRGERIDFSRFIKKGTQIEEKAYVSKHSFADFPFNPQLHKNIERAGYTNPRPIQDQAMHAIIEGRDVFGMANTGTGKTAAFLLPLIEKISKNKKII